MFLRKYYFKMKYEHTHIITHYSGFVNSLRKKNEIFLSQKFKLLPNQSIYNYNVLIFEIIIVF